MEMEMSKDCSSTSHPENGTMVFSTVCSFALVQAPHLVRKCYTAGKMLDR